MNLIKNLYHWIKKNREDKKIARIRKKQPPLNEFVVSHKDTGILYITNNHSGGTKSYEEILLKEKDACVLRRVGYTADTDRYYAIEIANETILIESNHYQFVFDTEFKEIILSTLIDFDNWSSILEDLINYKRTYPNSILRYLIHDFHCICPKCNLFIDGRYYDPDDADLPQYYELKGKKIALKDWQTKWREFLAVCDEIRCFSQSSKVLILTAYPMLDEKKVTVVPHDMSYCHNTPIEGIEKFPFHMGVVGACFGDFKGKPVVTAMIKRYGNNVPITLVGSQWWRFMLFRRKVKYLGPYERDELQKIIENNKISCVLFPSLWPETFSYLVSELMLMNIPVLCFDYGAQAEKIKNYEKGILLNNTEELWEYIENNK